MKDDVDIAWSSFLEKTLLVYQAKQSSVWNKSDWRTKRAAEAVISLRWKFSETA